MSGEEINVFQVDRKLPAVGGGKKEAAKKPGD